MIRGTRLVCADCGRPMTLTDPHDCAAQRRANGEAQRKLRRAVGAEAHVSRMSLATTVRVRSLSAPGSADVLLERGARDTAAPATGTEPRDIGYRVDPRGGGDRRGQRWVSAA
jgi:hypothetical protein